jgi:Kef-type K+ transport system membrane component KefB
MNTTEIFLIALLIIFTAPYLVWRLARTDYWAPLVVVQIVGGILLGPGVLGAVYPDYYAFVFNPKVVQSLNGIAWWAVMLFVWLAGVELDLRDAWRKRGETSVTAGLALLVPLLTGAGVAALLAWQDLATAQVAANFSTGGAAATAPANTGAIVATWQGPGATSWQFVLGVGMACAVTALPILVLFLDKLALLRQPLGQRILRYASLDDIAIWAVLALILLDWNRVGRQALFLAAFAVLVVVFRWGMRLLPQTDRWYVSLIWLAACAFGADWCGLHYMVGAFLAGAVTDSEWFDRESLDKLRHHVLLVMMPVFFLSTGLRTQWEAGGAQVLLAAGGLLAAAVVGKLVGVRLAGKLLGWAPEEASLIGWLLQTKALIMIIFANILLDKAVITPTTFTALLLMAVGSTMLTIPVVTPKLRKMGLLP